MASAQTTLNDYFKCKRNINDGKSKQNLLDNGQRNNAENKEILLKSESIAPPETVEIKLDRVTAAVTAPVKRRQKVTKNSKSNTGAPKIKRSENIALAFQKIKASQSNEASSSIEISTTAENGSKKRVREDDSILQEDCVSEQVTPNKENEESLQNGRKRKCTRDETEQVATPESSKTPAIENRATRSSARKRLPMSETSGPTEKDKSVAALKQQLSGCNKLSQLRAQLLRVKQCEKDLSAFRATVRQAQQQQHITNESPTKSPAGLRSPMKPPSSPLRVPSSPLKAPSSPRKLFSPHRLAAAPYPRPPASPRVLPHPQLEHFSSLDVEVPVSPCKTPTKTPPASPLHQRAPAYQRYHHLTHDSSATDTAHHSELGLPYKYRVLRELFRSVDTVVSLLHNRHEAITFTKLKAAVQQMIRRTFVERHLGQLKNVFPLAYFFKQEKVKPGTVSASGTPNKNGYTLALTANLNYKQGQSSSNARVNLLSKLEDNGPTFRKMDSGVMVERRSIFHAALIKILHKHHSEFLKTLEPSVVIPDEKSIRRWHPSFPLEEVPDVEPAELPQPPNVETLTNAAQVLCTARNLFSLNPRMEAAVEQAAAASQQQLSSTAVEQRPKETAAPQQHKDVSLALKGISVSLLEKIRAREAAAARQAMVRSPAQSKALAQLSALPEMARIIRHTFLAEKKAALPWDSTIAFLRESHQGMLTTSELEEHLELLLKEAPSWIAKHKLSAGIFLKINKKTDINVVMDKLKQRVKEQT